MPIVSLVRTRRVHVVLLLPGLLGVAVILDHFAWTAMHWEHVLRPVAVVFIGATAVATLLAIVTGRPLGSAVATTVTLLLGMRQQELLLAAAAATGFVAILGLWRGFRGRPSLRVPNELVVLLAVILVGVSAARLGVTGVITLEDFESELDRSTITTVEAGLPSVYALLLDGYPRQDTLANLGIDNEPFLAALSERGIVTDRQATTLFRRSELTLASTMLSDPEPLLLIGDPDGHLATLEHRRKVRREHLVNTDTMDLYRGAGYRLVYVPPPVTHVVWQGWDDRRDTGHLTDFEISLIQHSLVSDVFSAWIMDQQRDRVDASLDAWISSAGRRQELVVAHLMVPHTPFLWGPGRDPLGPIDCWRAGLCNMFHATVQDLRITVDEYASLLPHHLEAVNERVIAAIDRLLERDPEAVIIVFSDHGLRYEHPVNDEWHRSFFAIRGSTPLRADGLFTDLLADLLQR
jgi:hypothetical protein